MSKSEFVTDRIAQFLCEAYISVNNSNDSNMCNKNKRIIKEKLKSPCVINARVYIYLMFIYFFCNFYFLL